MSDQRFSMIQSNSFRQLLEYCQFSVNWGTFYCKLRLCCRTKSILPSLKTCYDALMILDLLGKKINLLSNSDKVISIWQVLVYVDGYRRNLRSWFDDKIISCHILVLSPILLVELVRVLQVFNHLIWLDDWCLDYHCNFNRFSEFLIILRSKSVFNNIQCRSYPWIVLVNRSFCHISESYVSFLQMSEKSL